MEFPKEGTDAEVHLKILWRYYKEEEKKHLSVGKGALDKVSGVLVGDANGHL